MMKVVKFSEIRDELINNMRRKMLIPVIGSGFTRGCQAYKGVVPSGKDYSKYMVQQIARKLSLTSSETEKLEIEPFSSIAEIYHNVIPVPHQKEYLKNNFSRVRLGDSQKKLLELFWPYVYTLNIDDGIENNSIYNHIVYSNRPVEKGIFDDFPCVIKLHGDVTEMLTYQDSKSEIFTQKQYVDSLKKNESLIKKLSHDNIFQNIIFIGCSLDDEFDLLASVSNQIVTSKYLCVIREPSVLEKIKYEKYGVTHCVVFNSYEEIYTNIYDAGIEAGKITIDDLEQYKSFSVKQLPAEYLINKPYLFFGKSLINRDHTISKPFFFITRSVTEKIFDNLSCFPLQFLIGSGCSGKSYILADIAIRIKSRDVFFFETKDRLTNQAFQNLTNRKNCVILADDMAFSDDQIEYFIANRQALKGNHVNVIIAVDKHNRIINGILKLYEIQGNIMHSDVPQILVSNTLNESENREICPLLTAVDAGIFYKQKTIVDNIIDLSESLTEKNKYHNIVPRFGSVSNLAALIALATERKIYSSRAAKLELHDELSLQCKATAPLIDYESTWTFESNSDDNSPIKYVVNAEYWLCYQLEEFSKRTGNYSLIVEAYKYIVTRIIAQEGKPNLFRGDKNSSYREYILFDTINRIFCSTRSSSVHGLSLIRSIYEGLNELLSVDPNYMHQRAKCYIKSAYFEKNPVEKMNYFDKAYRDANVAFQVFDNRYKESGSEKVLISIAHVAYTKALILCHKCNLNHYENIEENTFAVHMLCDALSSPYNSYEYAKKDSFNYNDVIKKIIFEAIAQKEIVLPDAYSDLKRLFTFIQYV